VGQIRAGECRGKKEEKGNRYTPRDVWSPFIFSHYYVTLAASVGHTAPVLASQAEAIVDLGRTWPQHRIDIHYIATNIVN